MTPCPTPHLAPSSKVELSIFQAAAEVPERLALIDRGVEVNFRELAERVRGRIDHLRQIGVDGSTPSVAMVGEVTEQALVLLYALIELAVPVVMIHPSTSKPEVRKWLADTGVETVLDPDTVLDPETVVDPVTSVPAGRLPEPLHDAERALAIVRTSGSSGRPKGVVLSRRAFLAAAAASAENLGWHDDDRWLLSLPIAHVGGLSIVTRCLVARRPVVLRPLDRFDARGVVDIVERDRVTLLSLVPTMLRRLLDLDEQLPGHLRAILLGGAGAPRELLRRGADRGWPILTTYGLTEACSQVATQRYGTVNRGGRGCEPVAGMEVRIRDDIVEVRGPSLMTGYLPAVYPPPFDAKGWFTTGDLGRLDDQGRLQILGRRDDVIVTGGENVHPREAEEVLTEHPAIDGACIFAIPDPEWGQAVAAALVAAQPPEDRDLRAFLRQRLASFQCPRQIAYVTALESTPTGKLDRRATARLAVSKLRPMAVVDNTPQS